MSEKVALVRLRAKNEQYDAAMKRSKQVTDDLAKSGKGVSQGFDLDAFGSKLTRNVTVPLVGLGVVAGKSAADFDAAFTRMQGLAGVTGDEVAGLKESIKGLASETGRGPQELADALYFLRSSGLDSAKAMDALEQSAKASAAGLGNTATIADAVSSAMNAYAKSGLTAARATDVLVATARAGKAEPEQLAASMGRVLPLASQLGVTFEDTGAAIAALSLSGNDAAASSTLLTNILSKLLKPSQQASESLDAVGLSTDGIRQMIADKGLLGTLETLRAKLGDAGFTRFLEDAQAVQGGLALTGENVDNVRRIFDELRHSQGATADAFKTWAGSDLAKNQRAMADLKVSVLQLGEAIAPIAANVANFASVVLRAFTSLPSGAQAAIVAFAGIAAATGPAIKAATNLSTAWSALGGAAAKVKAAKAEIDAMSGVLGMSRTEAATQKLTGALSGMSTGAGLAGIAAVGLGAGLVALADDAARARKRAAELKAEIDDLRSTAVSTGRSIDSVFDERVAEWFGENGDLVRRFKLEADTTAAALRGTDAEFQSFVDGLVGSVGPEDLPLIRALGTLREAYGGAKVGAEEQTTAAAELEVQSDATAGSTEALASEAQKQADRWKELADALDEARERTLDYFAVQTAVLSGQIGVEAALDSFADGLKENGDNWDINTEKGRANVQNLIAFKDAAAKSAVEIGKQNGSVVDGVNALQSYRDRLVEVARKAGVSEDEIALMIQTMGLTPEQILTTFKPVMDAQAEAELEAKKAALRDGGVMTFRANIVTGQVDPRLNDYHYRDRWGGVHEHARWGRIPAHIATTPSILYGERETGGEAMIPKNGDPIRSKKYLAVAASWYGMRVAPAGPGPSAAVLSSAMPSVSSGMGSDQARLLGQILDAVRGRPMVSGPLMAVYPAQGMSEVRIGEVAAERVARRLSASGVRR